MLSVLLELQRLKRLDRTGWVLRGLPPGAESVAAHSYGVALAAVLLWGGRARAGGVLGGRGGERLRTRRREPRGRARSDRRARPRPRRVEVRNSFQFSAGLVRREPVGGPSVSGEN